MSATVTSTPSPRTLLPLTAVPVVLALAAVLVLAGWDALAWMVVEKWDNDEYNHCWMIIPIALFMVATRARELAAVGWERSWAGLGLALAGVLLLLVGNLSAIVTVTQYAVIITFWGLVWAMMGTPAVRIIWPALAYLIFLVPLPQFLQAQLSGSLQLVSSQLGVAVIRGFGLPVYLEGNIIDLGNYQLAVAEACSGLRYLFPLMSFGFLCASIFVAPAWQRAVVFLTTVPLTILMNSLRIGVIGILVNYFGSEHAEGFTHFFEGWVVFMLCVGILFLEMAVFARLSGRGLLRSLRMDTPPLAEFRRVFAARPINPAFAAASLLVLAGAVTSVLLAQRSELLPQKPLLAGFPLVLGEWRGREQAVGSAELEVLKADDTLLANYVDPTESSYVSLWIAYYGSQRQGRSVHSPRSCLPGGGRQITSLEQRLIPGVRPDGQPLPVNRAVVGIDDQQQLVYYWFAQRGRLLTNEYGVKWYILRDALTMNRTDGALVRLVTPVDEASGGLEAADARLQAFMTVLDPKLGYFLPQRDAVMQVAAAR